MLDRLLHHSSFFPPPDPFQFFRDRMNAPAGIEPDNDRIAPVGCQCELNPCNPALPSPPPPNQADRFADVQLGGFHAGRNRFVFNRHFLTGLPLGSQSGFRQTILSCGSQNKVFPK